MPTAQDTMHSGHWSYPKSHLYSENTAAFVKAGEDTAKDQIQHICLDELFQTHCDLTEDNSFN